MQFIDEYIYIVLILFTTSDFIYYVWFFILFYFVKSLVWFS